MNPWAVQLVEYALQIVLSLCLRCFDKIAERLAVIL
jgi:hypothetical protein